jgi:hypothetical protein
MTYHTGTLTIDLMLPHNAPVVVVLKLHQCEHGVEILNPRTGWILYFDARHDSFTHPWEMVFQFNRDFVTKATVHVHIDGENHMFRELNAPGTMDLQGLVMDFLTVRNRTVK